MKSITNCPAIVLAHGVAEAGKDDRRLVAFANTEPRAFFESATLGTDNAADRA